MRVDSRIGIYPRLIVWQQHTVGTVLVFQFRIHDSADDIVTLLHDRIQIGLFAIA